MDVSQPWAPENEGEIPAQLSDSVQVKYLCIKSKKCEINT